MRVQIVLCLLLLLRLGNAASKNIEGKLCTLRSSKGEECVGTNTVGSSIQKFVHFFYNLFKVNAVNANEPNDSIDSTKSVNNSDVDGDDYIYIPPGNGPSIPVENDEDNYITILFGKRHAENDGSRVKSDSKNAVKVKSKISVNDGNRKKLRKPGEFDYYASKNDVAKKYIADAGGVFIDIADVTNARRQADDLITTDGYHWCNPGPTAITSFINQVVLHLIVYSTLHHD